jgi:outer membrane protein assembly factor BamB
MDRRKLAIGGMWIAAIAGAIGIYAFLEPDDAPERVTTPGESPLYEPGDRAPRASRRSLEVAADEGSPARYRGGSRHTGRSPYLGPTHVERAWQYRAGARITAQPIVGEDGTIYVGDHAGRVHAVRPDGTRRFLVNAQGPVWSSAAATEDAIFIGTDADAILSIDPRTGRERFAIRTAGDADSAIGIAPDGTLRFAAGRALYAMDTDGTVRWRFRARGMFVLSSPAIDSDGTAYIGSTDRRLYAIANDGRMRWDHRAGGEITSCPAIGDDGTIYFGSDDRNVHALTRDGAERWKRNVGGFVRAPVALGRNGDVIAGVYGPRPRVVSLDARTGAVRWEFPVGIAESAELGVASGPLVDRDGNIYFGAQDDFVYSLTPDGRMRWIHRTGADIDSAPVLTPDGLLVIGCDDGFLYALREEERSP